MDRRNFIKGGVQALSTAAVLRGQTPHAPIHRLPETDSHYRQVKGYVEDVPVPEYRWASSQAYESFRDIKVGIRIHWGIYSIRGQANESWPYLTLPLADRDRYNQLYKTWNPAGFDADRWTNLFTDAGCRMFAFTTKHHEGFSMFDTRTRVRSRANWTAPGGPKMESCDLAYSIMETPFRRDVVKELCSAAHRRNLKIALYFSHPDWYDADFRPYSYHPLQVPSSEKLTGVRASSNQRQGEISVTVPDPTPEETRRMMERHRAQLTELLTNYGRIDMLSLDMWLGPSVWPEMRRTLLRLRTLQPDVMLRARGIGNYGDYYTPEGFVPGSKENTEVPWMVIYPLGTSFSYDADAKNYKGAAWIVRNVVDTVAKGGNFQIGVGPDANGEFHPTAVSQLRDAGRWLKLNGEAIYATRPRAGDLWREGDNIRYTTSKDSKTTYCFLLNWPGRSVTLASPPDSPNVRVHMLGYAAALPSHRDPAKGLVIEIPEALQDPAKRPCEYAWTLRLTQG
jgi:alpha-L-fucosidase